ncbi:hypothetical protein [Desulfurococcus amylolyticus]|nr:hypothetical protein [Desulfurococcus amylolyticus]
MDYQSNDRVLGRINIQGLTEDMLENIISKVDEKVSEYLVSKLPKKTYFNTIISIEKVGDGLNLVLDLEATGPFGDVYNYEQILQDAINYARSIFEELLNEYVSRETH